MSHRRRPDIDFNDLHNYEMYEGEFTKYKRYCKWKPNKSDKKESECGLPTYKCIVGVCLHLSHFMRLSTPQTSNTPQLPTTLTTLAHSPCTTKSPRTIKSPRTPKSPCALNTTRTNHHMCHIKSAQPTNSPPLQQHTIHITQRKSTHYATQIPHTNIHTITTTLDKLNTLLYANYPRNSTQNNHITPHETTTQHYTK